MLVHKPKRTVCRIGTYDVIISSNNALEDDTKFNQFCQEFKAVLLVMSGQLEKKDESVAPTVAHEGVS